MNYYEELGIRADAETEDIRKAHRRLVKLMHPDHQPDPDIKLLAETQMRRLNAIVATLLDPDERGEYDEALRGRYLASPAAERTWRGMPWWLVSTVAAGILTAGAVWIWADHLGSAVSSSPASISPRETAKAPVPVTPATPPDPLPAPLPSRRPAVMLSSAPKFRIPKPDSQPVNKSSVSPVNTLVGEWVYAPKAGFYPPEFINFKLSQQHQGGLQGHYSVRYEAPGANKPIWPDVSFLVAAADKDARKFVWHSSNGSRGTLVVHDIDARTIRLEWRTMVSSGPPALTSSTATLVRRE
jgi:hypothetical protein